jgi:hypothetical protein
MATPPTGCILIFWHLSPAHLTQHTALQYCMAFVHKRLLLVQGHRPQATRACVCVCGGAMGAAACWVLALLLPFCAACQATQGVGERVGYISHSQWCPRLGPGSVVRSHRRRRRKAMVAAGRPAGCQLYVGGLHCIVLRLQRICIPGAQG